jgi:hypothetical protein
MIAGTGTTTPTTTEYNFETLGTDYSTGVDYDYVCIAFFSS